MKTIALKLDDYLLNTLNKKAKQKKITRMEVIRSAIINFLIHRNDDDAADLALMKKRENDKILPFNEVFK